MSDHTEEELEALWRIYCDPICGRVGKTIDERNMACTIRALIISLRHARGEDE
jgi:hypothetical protein